MAHNLIFVEFTTTVRARALRKKWRLPKCPSFAQKFGGFEKNQNLKGIK